MKRTLIALLLFAALALRAEDPIRPDPTLTPGAAFSNVTVEQITQKGYANKLNGGVRHVPAAVKRLVFKEYFGRVPGMPGHYEIDHLISLELGGSNDPSGVVPVVRLTEVFRQAAHSRIITTAHRINEGYMPEIPGKDVESDFYFIDRAEPEQIADMLIEMVKTRIPAKFGFDAIREIQVLCPMNRGSLGIRELNVRLQIELNPARADEPVVEKFGWQFRLRDKVIQTENNYDKDVFNGDIGQILKIDPVEHEITVRFDQREVVYDYGELDEVSLAYAITIHKSQGSEFPVVVIPLAMQQYMLLQRNLVYTGTTRGKKLVVLIGQRKALAIAVRNNRTENRFSGLLARLNL